ncbi:MAG TPA: hypothetical protein VFF28_02940 [Candidatus Nanoarchaeia archaeon]|nr:hypothetical protein [Candidatus Nanoarchaeia archaeon]
MKENLGVAGDVFLRYRKHISALYKGNPLVRATIDKLAYAISEDIPPSKGGLKGSMEEDHILAETMLSLYVLERRLHRDNEGWKGENKHRTPEQLAYDIFRADHMPLDILVRDAIQPKLC